MALDGATVILYTSLLFFIIVYLSLVTYVSKIHRLARVSTVQEMDCGPNATMESETVRYKLYDLLHADKADGMKRVVLIFCITIIVANAMLARVYYKVGLPLWTSSIALAIAALLLLLQTRATLGGTKEAKLAGRPDTPLAIYGKDFGYITDVLDKLKSTKLIYQGARNKSTLDGKPNAESAPVFDINLYQLELRLIERIQNQERLRSRQDADAFLSSNPTTGAVLAKYIKFYKDSDYPLFSEILQAYDDSNQPTSSVKPSDISIENTNKTSALVHLLANEASSKDEKKLNFTPDEFVALRAALARMATTDRKPYLTEITEQLAPLIFVLYVTLILIGYFGYKWALYRTSPLIVTLSVCILMAAYVFYYSYFG